MSVLVQHLLKMSKTPFYTDLTFHPCWEKKFNVSHFFVLLFLFLECAVMPFLCHQTGSRVVRKYLAPMQAKPDSKLHFYHLLCLPTTKHSLPLKINKLYLLDFKRHFNLHSFLIVFLTIHKY